MLTLAHMQYNSTFMWKKLEIWGGAFWKLFKLFIMYRIALYIGCSGPVAGSLTDSYWFLFRHSMTGPEHLICRTMRTVWKAWITSKMLCSQISNFEITTRWLRCSSSRQWFSSVNTVFWYLLETLSPILGLQWLCGRVLEWDWGASGSSLTGGTALCLGVKHSYPLLCTG